MIEIDCRTSLFLCVFQISFPIFFFKNFHFIRADSHLVVFDQLSVFSTQDKNDTTSAGLPFAVDVDFTYFLIEDEVGELHQELAKNYPNIIESRAKDAIKNAAAAYVSFDQFFRERTYVEELFRNAVQERWNDQPSLHCTLDQFHLGRIRIPETVATKQLEARIQNELNDREQFLQEAQIEREETAVQVNNITLGVTKVLRQAEAQASLIRAEAIADAELIKAQAQVNGTKMLLAEAGIISEDHKTAYTYIKTLKDRKKLDIAVSYLAEETVVRTAPAALD